MASSMEAGLVARFAELSLRSQKLDEPAFSRFLSPAEAGLAIQAAKDHGLPCTLEGGYPSAERVMACFHPEGAAPEFPIACVHITWDGRYGKADHRAILGAVLALGIDRSLTGDICLKENGAYLLVGREMASFIAANLVSAGRTPVQAKVLDSIPTITQAPGRIFRDTVASLRLDAVLASGLNIGRAEAAAMVLSGRVQVNHRPQTRTDAQLKEGDLLSVRGAGRLALTTVGTPNRKGRIPIYFESHGIH